MPSFVLDLTETFIKKLKCVFFSKNWPTKLSKKSTLFLARIAPCGPSPTPYRAKANLHAKLTTLRDLGMRTCFHVTLFLWEMTDRSRSRTPSGALTRSAVTKNTVSGTGVQAVCPIEKWSETNFRPTSSGGSWKRMISLSRMTRRFSSVNSKTWWG